MGTDRTLKGHTGWVNTVAVSPDGQRAVSASSDQTLKVWDLGSGVELMSFTADAPLYSCAVSPNGKVIIAGDQNGGIHYLRLMLRRANSISRKPERR